MKVVACLLPLLCDAARIRRAVVSKYVNTQDAQVDTSADSLLNATADEDQFVAAHNKYRCMHGAGPLKWNAQMATNAANWAKSCCQSGLQHSDSYKMNPSSGENLAAGPGSVEEAVKMWYDEVADCGNMPGCNDGKKGVVGHFTAMVWKSTTELGCAVNPTGWKGYPLYVCHYANEAPNMGGGYKDNVLAKSKDEGQCGGLLLASTTTTTSSDLHDDDDDVQDDDDDVQDDDDDVQDDDDDLHDDDDDLHDDDDDRDPIALLEEEHEEYADAAAEEFEQLLLNATAAKDKFVALHNKYRCMHGAGRLKWNNQMARNAANWAKSCCKSGLKHSSSYKMNPRSGENLAAGYGTVEAAVQGWYKEVSKCGPMPGCTKGKKGVVGHFTAMVWKSTTEIGCAVNPKGWKNRPLYVCHYAKSAPNIIGAYEKNVMGKRKSERQCGR